MSLKVYQSKLPKYAGHTEGPWEAFESKIGLHTDIESADRHITVVFDDDCRKANAALIADAPYLACEVERLRELCGELVGALESAKRLIEFEVYIPEIYHTCGTPDSIEACCVMARIQSAISNAKGEIDE